MFLLIIVVLDLDINTSLWRVEEISEFYFVHVGKAVSNILMGFNYLAV
jgi:hypothetical protein